MQTEQQKIEENAQAENPATPATEAPRAVWAGVADAAKPLHGEAVWGGVPKDVSHG